MRMDITHPGAGQLQYEIRGIVEFAKLIETTGLDITWENIGDPVAKGEQIPDWIKEIVAQEARNSASYGYSPTKGLDNAREFLANLRSRDTHNALMADNIIFFNGLGDAISKVYTWLNPSARVLGPNPAYPTHSSIEAAHGRSDHITYELDPDNGWLPDMDDIRNKVKYNPAIAAILLINPDNPTGMVYSKEILKQFVDIAKEFDLFLIADEIYANLSYADEPFTSLASVAGDVPTIIMRGLSKEVPWPGSRCGWLEFYNVDKDIYFESYIKSIEEAKMTEVCSTTLPQACLPAILGDARYAGHLQRRCEKYARRAQQLDEVLSKVKGLTVVRPQGAFYASITFNGDFKMPQVTFQSEEAEQLIKEKLNNDAEECLDKTFCYTLLAATGICTVPLSSGFNSTRQGFRMTLLEESDEKFKRTLDNIQSFVLD